MHVMFVLCKCYCLFTLVFGFLLNEHSFKILFPILNFSLDDVKLLLLQHFVMELLLIELSLLIVFSVQRQ